MGVVLVDRKGLHLTLIEDPDKPYSIVKGVVLWTPPYEITGRPVDVSIQIRCRTFTGFWLTSDKGDVFKETGQGEHLNQLGKKILEELGEDLFLKLREVVSKWFSVPSERVVGGTDYETSSIKINIYDETNSISFDSTFDIVLVMERIFTIGDLWKRLVSEKADPDAGTFFVNTVRMREEIKELTSNYLREKFSDITEWRRRFVEEGLIWNWVEITPNVEFYPFLCRVTIDIHHRRIEDIISGGRYQPYFSFWEIEFTVPVPKGTAEKLKETTDQNERLLTFITYLSLMRTEEAIRSVGGELNIEARNLNVSEPKSLDTLVRTLRQFLP